MINMLAYISFLYFREKKKEKDREDLWKKLENLEVKGNSKNKMVNNVS